MRHKHLCLWSLLTSQRFKVQQRQQTKKNKTGGNRSDQMCSSFCHQKKKVSHSDVTNAVTSFSRASAALCEMQNFR